MYDALDAQIPQIRLLEVSPSKFNTVISCTLRTVSLRDHPNYTAFSYVWEDAQSTAEIVLNDHENFKVTTNLETRL